MRAHAVHIARTLADYRSPRDVSFQDKEGTGSEGRAERGDGSGVPAVVGGVCSLNLSFY